LPKYVDAIEQNALSRRVRLGGQSKAGRLDVHRLDFHLGLAAAAVPRTTLDGSGTASKQFWVAPDRRLPDISCALGISGHGWKNLVFLKKSF